MGSSRTPARAGSPGPRSATRSTRTIRGLDADQRRAQRREQLLAAAFELFARDGYPNTSIEQICQTAYVGNKAFYDLFDSKEDCYLALFRQIAERVEQQIVQELHQAPDVQERPRRLLSVFAHALVDDPRVAVVTFGMAAGISARVEAQRRENHRWAASFIEGYWRHSHLTGDGSSEDDLDLHALAISTVGGLFESVTDWLHDADPSRPQTVDTLISALTTFVSVVQTGIAAHGSGRLNPG